MHDQHGPNCELLSIACISTTESGAEIRVSDNYKDALFGLNQFSHAIVLWWAHLCDHDNQRQRTIIKKPYSNSDENAGTFATRAPFRPNPVGLSVVHILSLDENTGRILVPFIDAEEGSPVIDIKPYFPASDRANNVKTPLRFSHWPTSIEDSRNFDWSDEFSANAVQ